MVGDPHTVDLEAKEDEALVLRAQAGDPKAFDELVLKHNKRLYALIYHMTQNREDTYDLLQDVFAKAYRSIKKFKGKSSFYTWLHRIAVNTVINHLKKAKRRRAFSFDEDLVGTHYESTIDQSSDTNPRKVADLKLLQEKLRDALMTLSAQHRAVVTMFDMQGLPHAKISKILGISEGTVRSRLFYAHRNLQSQLEEFKKML